MKVGIYSDLSDPKGYYSKIDGLLAAANRAGLDYSNTRQGKDYDVVINWEPLKDPRFGTRLTVVWCWDTHRTSMIEHFIHDGKMLPVDVLFRAHATFYYRNGFDLRKYPTYWMPPAVDIDVFKRNKDVEIKHDLVFVGGRAQRKELEYLQSNFNVGVYGDGHPFEEYVDLLSTGKVVISAPYRREFSKRTLEAMAIGPAIMTAGPDYQYLFEPFSEYIPIYDEPDTDHLREVLNNQELLDIIAQRGRERVRNNFTFDVLLQRINRVLRYELKRKEH